MKRLLILFAALLTLPALACGSSDDTGPPRGALVVPVWVNSSAYNWATDAAFQFNQAEMETGGGEQIYVELESVEAGQAISQFESDDALPAIWLPDNEVWASVAADKGIASYQSDCVSMANSPLTLAMWQPIAESLGWPSRDIGWLDVGSLAADPSAWAYYSGGQFGDTLRLGHTHPGLSASGASALLAVVQSAQSKTDAVSVTEIQQPITQASVGTFEGSVSWFSSDTGGLAATMGARGAGFLGAAVLYESDVVTYNQGEPETPIVPIYPFEGTFVANHPACISADLDTDAGEAAGIFREFLLSEEIQQMGLNDYGLRPANAAVSLPVVSPALADYAQPALTFAAPSVETIYAVQDVWQAARKDVNMVMLLDVSGSMNGSKINNMKEAAVQFVEQMGDDDFLTIITFSHELEIAVNHQRVGDGRDKIVSAIERLDAQGDTALYDAIGAGAEFIAETTASQTSNALVVLTDGLDTYSYRYSFNRALVEAAASNDTTVFTIAYGSDADENALQSLAEAAYGNYYQGSEADIAGIYEEMSAAFGGNLGIGR